MTLVVNVVEELRNSRNKGAYNVDGVLEVMVGGLEKELNERLDGKFWGIGVSPSPPIKDATDRSNGALVKIDTDNFDGVKEEIAKISDGVRVDEMNADVGLETKPRRRRRVASWIRRQIYR